MTLVVYKNKKLAADTRTTHSCSTHVGQKCAHCGEDASAVNDGAIKIYRTNAKHQPKFRDDEIVAYGSAGDVAFIDKIRPILRRGSMNLEDAFNMYKAINPRARHGSRENTQSCTFLLVGKKLVYRVRMSTGNQFDVDDFPLDGFVAIGSGTTAAGWINRLVPTLDADSIINLVMAHGTDVGGNIDVIDLTKPEEILTERAIKQDPKTMLISITEVFAVGAKTLSDQIKEIEAAAKKKAAAKKPVVKKAPAKKPPAPNPAGKTPSVE